MLSVVVADDNDSWGPTDPGKGSLHCAPHTLLALLSGAASVGVILLFWPFFKL